MLHDVAPQAFVAIAGTGLSAGILAVEVLETGATPSTGVQSVLLAAAVSVFLFFDRRERQERKDRADDRRKTDAERDAELQELRAEVRRLNAALVDAYRKAE